MSTELHVTPNYREHIIAKATALFPELVGGSDPKDMYPYGFQPVYMSSYDSSLASITALPYLREQTCANAVALYPKHVRDEAKARGLSSSQVDAKEVFQILVIYENHTRLCCAQDSRDSRQRQAQVSSSRGT
ncbi:hypothetical protein CERZMDRAFT_96351 [Cercospora zeae-maydis SCOH1-5]|uniref:Uncharacterized protein n=1 Tax=Cercospora zeae-maydis SCOH1-5 TaxID=717836 RepID=A0A6A6FJV3_9PEZI|nr:hypothetical protein CERZMDRAFT_96351 [Cercospora zeae-maydis SCOH1-5]